MKVGHRIAAAFAGFAILAMTASSCSLGEGTGAVSGSLDIPECWSGRFDLNPNFFAAVPVTDGVSMQIRIQNGGDYDNFSDGLVILVDDINKVRSELGQPLSVDLPTNVQAPGVPLTANPNPAIVHMSLYLERTCHTQNVIVYGVPATTMNQDGSCGGSHDGGAATDAVSQSCSGGSGLAPDASVPDASTSAPDAGPVSSYPVGSSSITFQHLFNGNPDETDAAERLTEGTFDIVLTDPRTVCPGGVGPAPACQGHLTGNFKFYFERGRPAQPFP